MRDGSKTVMWLAYFAKSIMLNSTKSLDLKHREWFQLAIGLDLNLSSNIMFKVLTIYNILLEDW